MKKERERERVRDRWIELKIECRRNIQRMNRREIYKSEEREGEKNREGGRDRQKEKKGRGRKRECDG